MNKVKEASLDASGEPNKELERFCGRADRHYTLSKKQSFWEATAAVFFVRDASIAFATTIECCPAIKGNTRTSGMRSAPQRREKLHVPRVVHCPGTCCLLRL